MSIRIHFIDSKPDNALVSHADGPLARALGGQANASASSGSKQGDSRVSASDVGKIPQQREARQTTGSRISPRLPSRALGTTESRCDWCYIISSEVLIRWCPARAMAVFAVLHCLVVASSSATGACRMRLSSVAPQARVDEAVSGGATGAGDIWVVSYTAPATPSRVARCRRRHVGVVACR